MRRELVACIALLLATAFQAPAFAQPPASFAETPGTKRADEAFAEAAEAASRAYTRGREKELADWLRVYEKALASARSAGDLAGVEYLTDAIARSKEAGFVVKPPPPEAVKYGKHSYARFSEGVGWHVAQRRCELMGGHLLTIESTGEADFVMKSFGSLFFWVGAGDFVSEGRHVWLDGSPFQAFGRRSQFDNSGGLQHAVLWDAKNQSWVDGDEGLGVGFICEWER